MRYNEEKIKELAEKVRIISEKSGYPTMPKKNRKKKKVKNVIDGNESTAN
ncbi:hypothetical protein [Lysinibacillus fusiformis]|nr:hypothetical protein [Lysinibacillus fusiformis]MBI6863028.1 hypothetical protein [Lysinibacillus fusiformis]